MFLPEHHNFYHAKQNIFFGHDKICIPPPPQFFFLVDNYKGYIIHFSPPSGHDISLKFESQDRNITTHSPLNRPLNISLQIFVINTDCLTNTFHNTSYTTTCVGL